MFAIFDFWIDSSVCVCVCASRSLLQLVVFFSRFQYAPWLLPHSWTAVELYSNFMAHKSSIPFCGAVVFNEDMANACFVTSAFCILQPYLRHARRVEGHRCACFCFCVRMASRHFPPANASFISCMLLFTIIFTQVLVVKGWEGGRWGFPRGKKSRNERPLECAMRELREVCIRSSLRTCNARHSSTFAGYFPL